MRKRPAAMALEAPNLGNSQHYPEWLQIEYTQYDGSGLLPPPLFWTIRILTINHIPYTADQYPGLPPSVYFSKRHEAVTAARALRQHLLAHSVYNIISVQLRVCTIECPPIHPGLTDSECQEYFGISVYQERVPPHLYPLTYHPYFTTSHAEYRAARSRDIADRWSNFTLALLHASP